MTDETDADAPDAATAFSALGHPLRLATVTTLHERAGDAPLAFSRLYDAVGADDSGQFNYHLDELVPHFVAKGEDGYRLTAAGERIARAVTAGTYTAAPTLEPFPLEGACYRCGAEALRGSYEEESFTVACDDCGRELLAVSVPPSLVRDRDPAAFVDAFERWSRFQVEQARRGICPDCGGHVEPSVGEETPARLDVAVLANYDCTVCGRSLATSFGVLAGRLSAVREFHRERGGDLDASRYWEVPQYMAEDYVTVEDRDPWRIGVRFPCAGDACTVTFDGSLEAVGVAIEEDVEAE